MIQRGRTPHSDDAASCNTRTAPAGGRFGSEKTVTTDGCVHATATPKDVVGPDTVNPSCRCIELDRRRNAVLTCGRTRATLVSNRDAVVTSGPLGDRSRDGE